VPVNARDGTLVFSYRDDDTRVVEAPLLEAGLVTNSSTVLLSFQQPLWKSPQSEFTLGGSMELRESETFIFDTVPFPAFNGSNRLNLTILRFWQTYLTRSVDNSLGIWSQFSFGLPIFGASSQSEFLNTSFFSWQGQVQYAAQLGQDWIFLTRLQGQWTPDSVPVIEQFALGGMSTVRGYRQNIRSGDSGLAFSVEFRRPLGQDADWGTVTPYTFFDFGAIWNNQLPITYPNSLASVGVGLEWQIEEWFLFGFNYGLKLIEDPSFGSGSFQDHGLNFWLQLQTSF
jgi:hemolysin activation/secretion protein